MVTNGLQDAGVDAARTASTATTSVKSDNTQGKQATSAPSQAVPLETAVTKLNDHAQSLNRKLSFSIDQNSGRTIVKVFNGDTEELIRQIPAEQTLKLAEAIDHQLKHGVIIETKA